MSRIAFVLCPSFHGATLLSLFLNNHSQIVALGDTLPSTDHLDFFCSCGDRIDACWFWQAILVKSVDTSKNTKKVFNEVPQLSRNLSHNSKINSMLAHLPRQFGRVAWKLLGPVASSRFLDDTIKLREIACQLHNAKLFIDGSKSASRVAAYSALSGDPVTKVLHLARDPRGYYASCSRSQPHMSFEEITSSWWMYHAWTVRIFANDPRYCYLFLRYEDFCADQQFFTERVLNHLGLAAENLSGPPKTPHHVIGHEMLVGFDGNINAAESWRRTLPLNQQREIIRATLPWSEFFGYA
jgi:hypothetical protein